MTPKFPKHGFHIPADLPESTQALLAKACKLPRVRDPDLVDLMIQFEGGDEALSERFHPRLDSYDYYEWQDLKRRLMLHVNLVKAITRRLRSAVLGGSVRRTVVRNPYKPEIEQFLRGRLPAMMRQRLQNCILFGTGPTGITLHDDRLGLWLPNSVYTHVIPGDSVYDPAAVVEFCDEGKTIRFATKHATGVLRKKQVTEVRKDTEADQIANSSYVLVSEKGFGFLPANIGYGEDLRPMGKIHGGSLAKDAVKPAIRATDTMFNGALMGKIQTRALLVLKGLLDQQNVNFQEMMKMGIIMVDENGSASYAIPDSKIGDMLSLLDKVVEIVSLVVGVPTYDLSPGRYQQESAESARRQQLSLTTQTHELVEAVIEDEQDIVLRATAMLRYSKTGEPVDLAELAKEVETRIEIEPMIDLVSSSERVANAVSLLKNRLRTAEEIVYLFNPKMTAEEAEQRAALVEEVLVSGGKEGQILQYHIDRGIVKINEVRERLSLPPIEGGDRVLTPEEIALAKGGGEQQEAP